MTAHPIDTEALRREALGQLGRVAADPRWPGRVLALLDLLAAAEHRATRAERRIKAVRELHVKEPGVGTAYCIDCEQPLPCDTIHALDGDA